MNDKKQPDTMTKDASVPFISGIGARLKSARETQHMSTKDAASRLNLNVKYIELIENEDFSHGLPNTFMKGYLRSYARLLNFSEDEVNHFIDQLGMSTPENTMLHTPTWHTTSIKHKKNYNMHWMTYIIILILGLLAFIRWNSHLNDTDSTSNTINNNVNQTQPIPSAPPSTTVSTPPTTTNATQQPATTATPVTQEPTQSNRTTETTEPTQPSEPVQPAENTEQPSTEKNSTSSPPQSQQNVIPMKMAIPEPGLDGSDDDNSDNNDNNY